MSCEGDNLEFKIPKLAEIHAEYQRLLADPTTDSDYRQELIVFKDGFTEPPKDCRLAAIWYAYGPFRRVDDNPIEEIVRMLHPNITPESVAEGWEKVRLQTERAVTAFSP